MIVKRANNSAMRFSSLSALALGVLLTYSTPLVSAGSVRFQSGATQTSLLELYTSQGSSSCPPAEASLSRLKDSPKLCRHFVPGAFSLDYRDYLSRTDPFS